MFQPGDIVRIGHSKQLCSVVNVDGKYYLVSDFSGPVIEYKASDLTFVARPPVPEYRLVEPIAQTLDDMAGEDVDFFEIAQQAARHLQPLLRPEGLPTSADIEAAVITLEDAGYAVSDDLRESISTFLLKQ